MKKSKSNSCSMPSWFFASALVLLSIPAQLSWAASSCSSFDVDGRWKNGNGVHFKIDQNGCNSAVVTDLGSGVKYHFDINQELPVLVKQQTPIVVLPSWSDASFSEIKMVIHGYQGWDLDEVPQGDIKQVGIRVDATLRLRGSNSLSMSWDRLQLTHADYRNGIHSEASRGFVSGANMILDYAWFALQIFFDNLDDSNLTRVIETPASSEKPSNIWDAMWNATDSMFGKPKAK